MESTITIAFQIVILVFSVVLHEVSHGLAAEALGDPTPRAAGRLTLNPIRHLDPVGSVLLPIVSVLTGGFIIGWAKPVPYNPYLLRVRNREFGSAVVGAAGPAANILLGATFGTIARTAPLWAAALGPAARPLADIATAIALINIGLAVFNLVPIPPLDGSKVLFFFLPPSLAGLRGVLERYGFLILLGFILAGAPVLVPAIRWLSRLLLGVPF